MGLSSAVERRWKRWKVDIRVKLRRAGDGAGGSTVVRSFELSEGGMSVYVPDSLAVGALVEVSFALPPENAPLRLQASVRNRRGFRYGLQFESIPESERFAIARYLGAVAGTAESSA